MRFEDIPPAAIAACWEWMRALLAPAIALDPGKTEQDVRCLLETGQMHALRLLEGGDGVFVYQVASNTLFLSYAVGRLDGGPKERLSKMRAVERAFIAEARRLGCSEMQAGGRLEWLRVLDGWEPDGGEGVSFRKAI